MFRFRCCFGSRLMCDAIIITVIIIIVATTANANFPFSALRPNAARRCAVVAALCICVIMDYG